MSATRQFLSFTLLRIGLAIVPLALGETATVPDDRDRQVLEKRDGKWAVAWYHVARFV